jgi:hypothetical protein
MAQQLIGTLVGLFNSKCQPIRFGLEDEFIRSESSVRNGQQMTPEIRVRLRRKSEIAGSEKAKENELLNIPVTSSQAAQAAGALG